MEGLFFYWICWLLWIIITFLMEKSRTRQFFGIWLLMLLIFSKTEIMVAEFNINASIFILYIGSIVLLAVNKRWLYHVFSAICIVFGYLGIMLWEQISPVWMFLPREAVIPATGFILLSLLTGSYIAKIAIWCLGVSTGEIIFSILLNGYGFKESIGDFAFLDVVMIEIGIIYCLTLLHKIRARMEYIIQSFEKQKNKIGS